MNDFTSSFFLCSFEVKSQIGHIFILQDMCSLFLNPSLFPPFFLPDKKGIKIPLGEQWRNFCQIEMIFLRIFCSLQEYSIVSFPVLSARISPRFSKATGVASAFIEYAFSGFEAPQSLVSGNGPRSLEGICRHYHAPRWGNSSWCMLALLCICPILSKPSSRSHWNGSVGRTQVDCYIGEGSWFYPCPCSRWFRISLVPVKLP